jgi:hypothetical protein
MSISGNDLARGGADIAFRTIASRDPGPVIALAFTRAS